MRIMTRLKWILLAAPLALLLFIGTVSAKPEANKKTSDQPKVKKSKMSISLPPQDKEYSETTSPENQEEARKLFKLANQRFEQRRHDDALRIYRKAYKRWAHPRILFNIAVCLGFLSRPLESAETFKEVLRYGPDPITPQRYKQASERYTELMGQLAELNITCEEQGAKVFVNGKPIGTAPITKKVTMGPGSHMVSANLEGKIPYSTQVRLEPGAAAQVEIILQDFADVVRHKMVSRYHWAVPTSVSAAAGVILAAGAGLLWKGRDDIDVLERDIQGQIDAAGTGATFTYDTGLEDRAIDMQIAGQTLMGVAGAAAITATVLWIVRKKRVSFTAADEAKKKGESSGPTARPKGAGVEVRF